jgi:hypothetical protein
MNKETVRVILVKDLNVKVSVKKFNNINLFGRLKLRKGVY